MFEAGYEGGEARNSQGIQAKPDRQAGLGSQCRVSTQGRADVEMGRGSQPGRAGRFCGMGVKNEQDGECGSE